MDRGESYLSMEKLLVVEGGAPLYGEMKVSGSKNAALPIMAASLLSSEESLLHHIPKLEDVENMVRIMKSLGVSISYDKKNSLSLNPRGLNSSLISQDLASLLRASYYLWGALLSRVGYVKSYLPGGCSIGIRPVDLHLKGFQALGAKVLCHDGFLEIWAKELRGAKIYLDYPSVGATVNLLLAASLARGETMIENAAKEPEVVDLAHYLNHKGARVEGSGTKTIRVEGVERLYGAEYKIISDRIEAGTFMLAAAVTRGNIYLDNVLVEHLDSFVHKLREMGLILHEDNHGVHVESNGELEAVDIKTLPFPGYPSDLQAQGMVLLTQSQGISQIQETVWEERFSHVYELQRMGASIVLHKKRASITPSTLRGTRVKAYDLRGGAALILAGLVASGKTEIEGIRHINRGYENIYHKLKSLGASLTLEEVVPHSTSFS